MFAMSFQTLEGRGEANLEDRDGSHSDMDFRQASSNILHVDEPSLYAIYNDSLHAWKLFILISQCQSLNLNSKLARDQTPNSIPSLSRFSQASPQSTL
jgi:hypothetical protein